MGCELARQGRRTERGYVSELSSRACAPISLMRHLESSRTDAIGGDQDARVRTLRAAPKAHVVLFRRFVTSTRGPHGIRKVRSGSQFGSPRGKALGFCRSGEVAERVGRHLGGATVPYSPDMGPVMDYCSSTSC